MPTLLRNSSCLHTLNREDAPLPDHRLSKPTLVLDGALRYGCVTLQIDIYQPHQGGSQSAHRGQQQGANTSTSAADGADQEQQQQAQGHAQIMECIPEEVARWMSTTQLSEHLDAGTIMTVQVRVTDCAKSRDRRLQVRGVAPQSPPEAEQCVAALASTAWLALLLEKVKAEYTQNAGL